MRVFMAGTGAVASVMLRFLARERYIDEIICASNRPQEAKFLPKSAKIKVRAVNLANRREILEHAKGAECIINASLPDFNEALMEAALKIGSNYQDLCSFLYDLKTTEQLRFHKRFAKKGLVGMINTGVSPGVTNVLVANAADRLDSVSEVKIRVFEDQQSEEILFSWSPHVIINEAISPPLVYRNRKLAFEKPFGAVETYEFPKPIGKRKVVALYGDEVSTLCTNIGARNINYKAAGSDIEVLKAFYKLGMFKTEYVRVKKKKVVPADVFQKLAPAIPDPTMMIKLLKEGTIENAVLACSTEVSGRKDGRKVSIRSSIVYPTIRQISKEFPGATYVSYPTAISAFAFYKSMHLVDSNGVFAPESLSKSVRENILQELKNARINVLNSLRKG
ncbi:MAG: saccharopine dehydrogenase [archaeon GW2011_AR5]|nr:MAG: saccharopine dehydrogenase [archaeon GW2011_AR5]